MKRVWNWILVAAIPLLLISLSTSTATAPAAKATSGKPQTLVIANGPLRSFAQSAAAISWIDRFDRVYVKRLGTPSHRRVGSAYGNGNRATYAYTPLLTLIGSRAFWTTYDGGNSVEIAIYSGVPRQHKRTLVDVIGSDPDGSGTGAYFSGLRSDGTRLVYGFAVVYVSGGGWPTDCTELALGDRGIALIPGPPYRYGRSSRPLGTPSVMMLAASQQRIAVVPAAFAGERCPKLLVSENGPVQVYRAAVNEATLMSSVAPHGFVKAIALSPTQLAVLVRRADGTEVIERYDPMHGTLIGTTSVPEATAPALSISGAGIVYRVGRKIYLLANGARKLVWTAGGTPIGLSIEGRRIAWAENVKGRGRIVALTLR